MTIRPGSAADHDAALAVGRAPNGAFLGDEHVGPDQEARVPRHLATGGAFLLLAEDGEGTAVGADARADDGGVKEDVSATPARDPWSRTHLAVEAVEP